MRLGSAVLVACLLLAGCASDDSGTTTVSDQTSASETVTTTTQPTTPPSTQPGTTGTEVTTTSVTTTLPPSTTNTTAADPFLPSALDRSAIPWDAVGPGWYVVLFDGSKADASGSGDMREGPVALYLVSADGTRYQVAAWSADDRPWALVDATATVAVVAGRGATIDDRRWHVVDLPTGVSTPVHEAGFPEATRGYGPTVGLTRPTGANVVVYRSDGVDEWLERRTPDGTVLARLYEQSYTDDSSTLRWLYGYGGTSVIVAHRAGITEVANSGAVLEELWMPPDHLCDPVRWWDADTFLATCRGQGPGSAPTDTDGNPHTFYGRLWLLEVDGTAGVPLTEYPDEAAVVVDFGYQDAWPTSTETYLQWSGDCGASAVALLQADGTGEFLPIDVPSSLVTDGVEMVDIVDGQIAVYGWQGCAADVGSLFTTDLGGTYLSDLVPVVDDARSVIGVVGLATVHP